MRINKFIKFFFLFLGTISQLGVTIGLLGSQVLGLPNFLGTSSQWPKLLGMCEGFSINQFFSLKKKKK